MHMLLHYACCCLTAGMVGQKRYLQCRSCSCAWVYKTQECCRNELHLILQELHNPLACVCLMQPQQVVMQLQLAVRVWCAWLEGNALHCCAMCCVCPLDTLHLFSALPGCHLLMSSSWKRLCTIVLHASYQARVNTFHLYVPPITLAQVSVDAL